MKSPFRLDDRMALITGASSGIGDASPSDESGFMNRADLPIDEGRLLADPFQAAFARVIMEST